MKKGAKNLAKDIILGLIIFIVIEIIFMAGGLLVEQSQGKLITGIPSAIGLTIALLIGLIFLFKGREYVFIGVSLLAFVPPVILFVFSAFAPARVVLPTLNYSLTYVSIVVLVSYLYLFFKILKESK